MNVATARVIMACYKVAAYDNMGNKRTGIVGKQYQTCVGKMVMPMARYISEYMDDRLIHVCWGG